MNQLIEYLSQVANSIELNCELFEEQRRQDWWMSTGHLSLEKRKKLRSSTV